jgi:hypothetical protein
LSIDHHKSGGETALLNTYQAKTEAIVPVRRNGAAAEERGRQRDEAV